MPVDCRAANDLVHRYIDGEVTPQTGRIVAGPGASAAGAPSSDAPPASTALPAGGR